MTLEEKASLTSGLDFWQTPKINRLGLPSMFLSDGPHGIRKQAEEADHLGLNPSLKATCFPTAAAMANSWNVELGKEMGKALGLEAKAQGVNVLLGPGMNMKRNPLCGRNFEYFSEDPYLAGNMAGSYVKGIQGEGVSACLKHFACNNQETRRMVYDSIVDERALREIYLTGFEIAVKNAHPMSIMSSYNRINGEYANENHHLLQEILRDEWGFDGMVVSDWGGNNDRIKSLAEGGNLEMPTTKGETNEEIVKAIKEGRLDEAILDKSVNAYLNVLNKTSEALKEKPEVDLDEHHNLARRCAEECMVLLKNEDNLLPLRKSDKVAVIGDFFFNPRYQGAGSSIVNPTKVSIFSELKKDYGFNLVGIEKGYDRFGKRKNGLFKKAIKLAGSADVILYSMGLDEVSEAEGLDRANMKIRANQIELLKALAKLGKKIVLVITTGSAIELDFDKYASSVLYTSLGGQAGAEALLNIINGTVNPSGKLSESFPFKYEEEPTNEGYPFMGKTIPYKESIYIGYRYFDKLGLKLKYPFGYGLSYSTFEYSNLIVNENGIELDVTNTSDVCGKEIVEMYIGKADSAIFRAKRELKGFNKVEVKAHETKHITIPFDEYTFRFFNIKSNKFEIEAGEYQIYVGASLDNILLEGAIIKEGVSAKEIYSDEKLINYYSGDVKSIKDNEFEALLGYKLPNGNIEFVKKNRIIVDYNTTVMDLRYAKGWTGRAFAWGVRVAERALRFFGNRELANTLIMGVFHNPMRGLSRMSGGMISWAELNGLITMFNGHFFKGFKEFMKAGKEKKRREKALKLKEVSND